MSEQTAGASAVTKASSVLSEALRSLADRVTSALGIEIPFDAGDVNARNNSSMVILAKFDNETKLFSSDAGVPALDAAWDHADSSGIASVPNFVQLAHHGSRRNCSSAWLDRVIGTTGQIEGTRTAVVSCVAESEKHPSGKVVNAHKRRGCRVVATAGKSICHGSGHVNRSGWGPASPLGPMIEEAD